MLRYIAILVFRAITRRFRKLVIAFAGVALAIATLVLLEAIMEGVNDSMIYNSVSIHHGHIACNWQGNPASVDRLMDDVPRVEAILVRKQFGGTLRNGDNQMSLMMYGVDPANEQKHTIIAGKMTNGTYISQSNDLIIGQRLATFLGVATGDMVQLILPDSKQRDLRIKGIYRTGIELFDAQTGFVKLSDAPGNRHELAVFLEPGADIQAALTAIKATAPELKPVTWKEQMVELVQLVSLDYVTMNIVLVLVLIIMGFGISNTVYISVAERTREFGILRSMGMTPRVVQLTVLAEVVLLIGCSGIIGMLAGYGVVSILGVTGIDLTRWTSENPHFLASGLVYPRLTVRSLAFPGFVALGCAIIAAYMPARRAGKIKITEALRFI